MSKFESNNGVNVHLPEGYKGEPVEIVIRHGEAPVALDPKESVVTKIKGTIDSPLRWLEKRVSEQTR